MTSWTRRSALMAVASSLALLVPSVAVGAATKGESAGLQFEIYRDSRKQFRWRLKAANGHVLATSSEGYKAKADCRNAIDRIKEDARNATVEDLTG